MSREPDERRIIPDSRVIGPSGTRTAKRESAAVFFYAPAPSPKKESAVPKITSTTSKKYIGIGALQERYDCSHMFIERLLKCDPSFPRPVKLAPGRMAHCMWDEDELFAWERSRVVARSA